jgi:hypothetical protein
MSASLPIESQPLAAIERNCQLMELAKRDGEELETWPTRCGEFRIWIVPADWIARVGYRAALVR